MGKLIFKLIMQAWRKTPNDKTWAHDVGRGRISSLKVGDPSPASILLRFSVASSLICGSIPSTLHRHAMTSL
jgi:hypothetical protein